ncbi:MAG: hypothetical protein O2955_03025 [Planctomycetota bacterium]|nr:hypothetical protein [Planctomycetota bacterium]MDA1211460.1 hypothetical protein [Planctomycetota bacterium]
MPSGWTSTDINGHPAEMFVPESVGDSRFALLYLHEYGEHQLLKDDVVSEALDRHGVRVLAPLGGVCGWLDRVFPSFDEQVSPLDFLISTIPSEFAARWNVSPPGIGLLGFDVGGQGVLQLAYRQARKFPVVAAINPAIDFHMWYGHGLSIDTLYANQEDARQSTVTLQLHPLNWPAHQRLLCDPADLTVIDGVERLISKLNSTGILHEADVTTSAHGDRIAYLRQTINPVLDFILNGLAFEANRLV